MDKEKIVTIFCKDCIYAKEQLTNMWCKFHLINCWDDDFCSWGEAKEED